MRLRLLADEKELPEQADICGAAIDLINAEVSPVRMLSLATIFIEVGKRSQPHYHKLMEEIYYFIEGEGTVTVGDELFVVEPGVAVSIPIGKIHQIINTGDRRLKLISADSPSFDPSDIHTA
ncbi:MAG: hypothetical protein QOF24_1175 [Verrucomicrobiota bacterium]|jgi:mannose-6-phosphate isomerase-like protein (cupin superfamily)